MSATLPSWPAYFFANSSKRSWYACATGQWLQVMQYTRTSLSLKSASDALFPGMVAHSKPLNFGAGLPILSGAATTAAADKARAATLAKRNMQFSFEKDQGREPSI